MATFTAETLNAHLKTGGVVQIATAYRITEYKEKHAGMFFQGADGNLYVRAGKGSHCLSYGKGAHMMVTIRVGRWVKKG